MRLPDVHGVLRDGASAMTAVPRTPAPPPFETVPIFVVDYPANRDGKVQEHIYGPDYDEDESPLGFEQTIFPLSPTRTYVSLLEPMDRDDLWQQPTMQRRIKMAFFSFPEAFVIASLTDSRITEGTFGEWREGGR